MLVEWLTSPLQVHNSMENCLERQRSYIAYDTRI